MIYTIRSAELSVEVNSFGAELNRIQSSDGRDYLWQGDAGIWSGRAPILFPIVGALKDGQFEHKGTQHTLSKHGFARTSDFALSRQSNSELCFQLTSGPQARADYPWRFELHVRIILSERTLAVEYSVINLDKVEMLFNIGSHPAFNLPGLAAHQLEGDADPFGHYSVEFSQTERAYVQAVLDNGLLTRAEQACTLESNEQGCSVTLNKDLFNHDALVFRHIKSDTLRLKHDGQTVLEMKTDKAPHLGIWAKPAAPYVCIEPWWGHADFEDSSGKLADKDSIQRLPAGECFTCSMEIEFMTP